MLCCVGHWIDEKTLTSRPKESVSAVLFPSSELTENVPLKVADIIVVKHLIFFLMIYSAMYIY